MPLTHVTKGRVVSASGDVVVFKPANTTYELHLKAIGGTYDGPVDATVQGIIRGKARKAYTVPSGGLFVTPIMGPTRIIQGRVIDLQKGGITLSAVATVNVALPTTAGAVELANGSITHGSFVNVVLEPGATFELTRAAPAKTTVLTEPAAALE